MNTASTAPNGVPMPRAVLRQSAEVQRKLDERAAQRAALLTPTEPAPAPTPASSAAPAPAEAPTPPAASAPPAPTESPARDPRHDDPRYWEQRFRVVEGQNRVAVADAKAAKSEADGLRQRVAALQDGVRALKAAAPREPTDISKLFTQQEIEKFGEESCRVMADTALRIASDEVRRQVSEQVQPLHEQRQRDERDREAARKQSMKDQLTELFPAWASIDTTPGWLAWLADTDEASGLMRQEILDAHIARGNARAIAKMFQVYEATTRTPVPPAVPHGNGAGGTPMTTQAAPTPAEVQGLRHPTVAEKRDFYKRAALNKVSAEERAQFESRLKLPNPG